MTKDNEPTAKLDVPTPATSEEIRPTSDELPPSTSDDGPPPDAPEELPRSIAKLRSRLESTGWLDVSAAAGLGFLVLLAVGGVLVLAAKLNFPQLGSGGDLLSAFNAVVIAGLGTLGIPVVIDGLAAAALPLGALIVVGFGIMWSVNASIGPRSFSSTRAAVEHGLRAGVPFGLLCWFFALVFRFRGTHPVSADAGVALVAGAFWGAVFGALGAVRTMESLRSAAARVWSGLRARDKQLFDGASAGGLMLVVATLLGAAATLLWIIVALAKGPPGRHFGAGDALAYVVYLVAFLPNLVVGIVSLAFGAPIDVGAKIDVGGRLLGPLREYSLMAWGKGEPPGYLWLIVLIPVVACGLGGLYARRRSRDSSTMVPVLLTASAVFAITITLLGAIGPVRLSGVLKGSGYALVAPDAVIVLVSTFLVAGVVGFLGWKLGESSSVLKDRFPPTD